MGQGLEDGGFGDGVEHHPLDRDLAQHMFLLEHLQDMPGDCLAFPVRVRRDEDFARILGRALQLRDRFFLSRNWNQLRLEALDVDAELLLGQIHDVANGRANAIAAAEVFADGLRLGRRFDDDERLRSSRRWRKLVLMHLGRDVPAARTLAGCRAGRLASRSAGFRSGFPSSHSGQPLAKCEVMLF